MSLQHYSSPRHLTYIYLSFAVTVPPFVSLPFHHCSSPGSLIYIYPAPLSPAFPISMSPYIVCLAYMFPFNSFHHHPPSFCQFLSPMLFFAWIPFIYFSLVSAPLILFVSHVSSRPRLAALSPSGSIGVWAPPFCAPSSSSGCLHDPTRYMPRGTNLA